MFFRKIFLFTALLLVFMISTGFASLLDTTDQILNTNTALGGNSAANLFMKKPGIEAGMTLIPYFKQNKSILESQPGYTGTNLEPREQFLNMYAKYNEKLDTHSWWSISYRKDYNTSYSFKIKRQADENQKIDLYSNSGTETLSATYARNNLIKGMLLGAEIGLNKDVPQIT